MLLDRLVCQCLLRFLSACRFRVFSGSRLQKRRRDAARAGDRALQQAVQHEMEEHQAGVFKDRSVGRRLAFYSEASCSANSKIADEDKILYVVIDGCDQAPAGCTGDGR